MLVYIDNVDILQYEQCLDQTNYSKDKYYALNTFIKLFSQSCLCIISLTPSIVIDVKSCIYSTIHLLNE